MNANLAKKLRELQTADRTQPVEMWPHEVHAARDLAGVLGIRGGYQPGSFTTSLLEALIKADTGNRERLLSAFPEYTVPFAIARESHDWLALTIR